MKRCKFLPVAVAAMLFCLLAAPWAAALPVAVMYPGMNNALAQPSDDEEQLLDMIQKDRAAQGKPQLQWDPMTSAVAREQSADMMQYGYLEYVSPRLGTLEYRLHRAGISVGNARFAVYRMPSPAAVAENMRKSQLHLEPATGIGIGIARKGPQEIFVTVILYEKYSVLEPFPTLPILGAEYKIAGRLEGDLKKPQLIVTMPDGTVTETELKLSGDRKFGSTVRFDKGRGEYSVEIAASGKLGPLIVDLMHCYAGVDYPSPTVPAKNAPLSANVREGEQRMFGLINKARAEAHLPALAYDAHLADVARQHSDDMFRNKYFAHDSPTLGNLAERMARGGIKAKKFMENIANNQDLAAAHQELMDSPGHRRSILDPDVTHVGVGIVHAENGQILITEDFMQEFQIYDTAALTEQLIEKVNAARAAAGVGAMAKSDMLSGIALENSRVMMLAGKFDQSKVKTLVAEKKVRLKSVQIALLESGDPPKAEQFQEALKARYLEIGVGIVQNTTASGDKALWTTLLLGER